MRIENRNSYRLRQVTCVILGICAAIIVMSAVVRRWEVVKAQKLTQAQEQLSKEVFRFHVLANSDGEKDQDLKLYVRDEILEFISREYSVKDEPESLEGTKEWVASHLDEIGQVAEKAVQQEGYTYPVAVHVRNYYFPDRRYGDVLFPKGYYDALRVEIGAAAGKNWWCVLYPSLCFTDATCAVVTESGNEELSKVLTVEDYETITVFNDNFKIKSFFYDLFKERTGRQMEEGQ